MKTYICRMELLYCSDERSGMMYDSQHLRFKSTFIRGALGLDPVRVLFSNFQTVLDSHSHELSPLCQSPVEALILSGGLCLYRVILSHVDKWSQGSVVARQ